MQELSKILEEIDNTIEEYMSGDVPLGIQGMCTVSAAVHMIRVQAEQIRRMSAEEYLKEKTGSGADGQKHTE